MPLIDPSTGTTGKKVSKWLFDVLLPVVAPRLAAMLLAALAGLLLAVGWLPEGAYEQLRAVLSGL